MAVEQLKKLPGFVARRRAINELYDGLLGDLKWLDCPKTLTDYCASSYYFYHIQVKHPVRDALAKYLRDREVYTTFRYFQLHLVKHYEIRDQF